MCKEKPHIAKNQNRDAPLTKANRHNKKKDYSVNNDEEFFLANSSLNSNEHRRGITNINQNKTIISNENNMSNQNKTTLTTDDQKLNISKKSKHNEIIRNEKKNKKRNVINKNIEDVKENRDISIKSNLGLYKIKNNKKIIRAKSLPDLITLKNNDGNSFHCNKIKENENKIRRNSLSDLKGNKTLQIDVSSLKKTEFKNIKNNSNKENTHERKISEIFRNDSKKAYFVYIYFRKNIINDSASFIVDTGAELTLIKENVIANKQYSTNNIIQLKGINEKIVFTLGTVSLNIKIGEYTVPHDFHIIPESFPINHDGILGRDFLQANNSIIDYNQGTLTISGELFKLLPPKNSVILKARSETIVKIPCTKFKEGTSVYYETFQIKENVIMGSCLSIVNNKECVASILNSSEKNIEFELSEIPMILYEGETEVLTMTSSQENNQKSNNFDRISELKKCLNFDHLNDLEYEGIIECCSEYADIFKLENDKLSFTTAIKHTIPLIPGKGPIYTKPYRLPYAQRKIIDEQVDEMLQENIIAPSKSPYNSPLIVVPKKPDKNGEIKYRICIDFRKINSISVGDSFPLPRIDDILDSLGKARYFTTLDMTSGYHQIKMSEEDQEKTAFSTSTGHYEYLRLPFGLKGAGATFQRLMNTTLSGLIGIYCFVYLDDIIIPAYDISDHNKKLRKVFDQFRQYNLKLSPGKCHFLRKEINFLGHSVSEKGLHPDPSKINCIKNSPTPKNQKEVKSFLAFASYYRRFLPNFAKIAQPLTNLLKKEVKFLWTDICENAFQNIKNLVTSPPILKFADFNKPFIITTDASNKAIGAVLSQGEIGKDLPISFASRVLNSAEINYSVTEKEMLAICWAVNHFRPYVFQTKFLICTDHKPIAQALRIKNPGSRLDRLRLKLEEYDYSIVYKPGKNNTNADYLSRIYTIVYDNDVFKDTQQPLQTFDSDNSISHYNYLINPHNVNTSLVLNTSKNEVTTYLEFQQYIKSHIVINKNVEESDEKFSNLPRNYTPVIILPQNFNIQENTILDTLDKTFNILYNIENQKPKIPEVLKIEADKKYLFCLICQEFSTDKIDSEHIWSLLNKLKSCCIKNNINKLTLLCYNRTTKVKWETIRTILRFVFLNSNISIKMIKSYAEEEETLSESEKLKIIKEYHDTPLGGHQGVTRTYKRMKMVYTWKNMKTDIKNYIKKCSSCQKNKLCLKSKAPLEITSTAEKPFEKCYLDIVGPLTKTDDNNKYLLTFQDDLTKYALACPIPDQESETVAKSFVENIICKYGIMQSIVTDQGTNFMSTLFKDICKLLKIKKITTTAYHPEANGQLERSHRTLAEYLRHFINENQQNWDIFIPYAMFTYNTTPHTATNYTPHELLFGFKAELPLTISKPPAIKYTYDDFVAETKFKLQYSHEKAKESIQKTKQNNKNLYDKKSKPEVFNVGDKVLLNNKTLRKGRSKKLEALWVGPYEIIERNSRVNYTIKKNRKLTKVHVNRIKHFYD